MTPKERKRYLRAATQHGCRIVNGKKHVKVFDPEGNYMFSLSHGSNGMSDANVGAGKVLRKRGWL